MRSLFVLLLFVSLQSFASDTTGLYNPYANVGQDVAVALAKAKAENKNVLLQIGGNWCGWCYKFHSFINLDTSIKRLVTENYVLYHLNYSAENKNEAYMKKLGNPERFGFPVLVVLDADGKRLYTQDSGLLEKGNGYDENKVKAFLNAWSPAAVNEKMTKSN